MKSKRASGPRAADLPLDGEGRAMLAEALEGMLGALRTLGEQESFDAATLMLARMRAPGVVTRAEGARTMALLHGTMASTMARGAAETKDPALARVLRERHRVALEEQRYYEAIAAEAPPED